jgi:hypothetical protein
MSGTMSIDENIAHQIMRDMGAKGGRTTKERHGHDHYTKIGQIGGAIIRENKERLHRYDAFFERHPELIHVMEKEERNIRIQNGAKA